MKAMMERANIAIRDQLVQGRRFRAGMHADPNAGAVALAARVREVTVQTGSVRRLI